MYTVHSQKCDLFLHDLVKLATADLKKLLIAINISVYIWLSKLMD